MKTIAVSILLSLLLTSCESKSPSTSDIPVNSEQRACLQKAKDEVNKEFVEFTKITIQQYKNKTGYMPLLIEERRKVERLCSIVAECYKEEPTKSFEFEECLEGWVNKSYAE